MHGLKRRWCVVAVACLLAGGILFWWITHGHARGARPAGAASDVSARDNAAVPQSAGARRRVTVVKPKKGGIQRLSIQPATIESFFYADLYAKVSGYLKWQHVDIGDVVKAGQQIAEIDAPEYQQRLNNAQAELRRAQVDVTLAQARVHTAEAEYAAASANVEQAKADLKKAEANLTFREIQYKRISELFAKNAIEERLVDEKDEERHAAAAAKISAAAAIVTSQAQREAAQARVEQARAEVEDARAKVEVAQAEVGNAQVFVEYTKIISPYNGVITDRKYHKGDFIRAAEEERGPPMLTVAETDVMRVVVLVPERDAPYADRGDKAEVELDAIPGKKFTAKVSRISKSEQRTSRAMRVEIDLQNESDELRDGMFGRVTIYLDTSIDALTVPASCVMANDEATADSVYVVKQGKAHRKKVKTGRNNGIRVEIVSGLSPDDEVIDQPPAYVTDGTPVEAEQRPESSDDRSDRDQHRGEQTDKNANREPTR